MGGFHRITVNVYRAEHQNFVSKKFPEDPFRAPRWKYKRIVLIATILQIQTSVQAIAYHIQCEHITHKAGTTVIKHVVVSRNLLLFMLFEFSYDIAIVVRTLTVY
jgi:hypothetical protein